MDMAIIRNLFGNTIHAAELLGVDVEFRKMLEQKSKYLAGYRIGSHGQLLEWDKEYKETEPQHRHLSHLFGLYPGCDIIPDTPEVFKAARQTLIAPLSKRSTNHSFMPLRVCKVKFIVFSFYLCK